MAVVSERQCRVSDVNVGSPFCDGLEGRRTENFYEERGWSVDASFSFRPPPPLMFHPSLINKSTFKRNLYARATYSM